MSIELRGIIQYKDLGKRYVDVMVKEGESKIYKRHRVGVDIKLNRDIVLTFLAGVYGIPQGQVVWPEHIRAEDIG